MADYIWYRAGHIVSTTTIFSSVAEISELLRLLCIFSEWRVM